MHSRFISILIATLALVLTAAGASAAVVPDLYSATAPVIDRSDEAREDAFQTALAQVLVRVTGLRWAAADPAALEVLERAGELVQQYRYTDESELVVGFDGEALERALIGTGLPVWGANRPVVLVWLAVDWGGGQRELVGSDTETEDDIRGAIEMAAYERGIPLVWPLLDTVDLEALTFTDVWGGFENKIEAASGRYEADAVLVGRASRGAGSRYYVRWQLRIGELRQEWRGSLDDGIEVMADRMSQQLAVRAGGEGGRATVVAISGIDNLRAYARVTSYLEQLNLVRSVGVDRVEGDVVVFRVGLLGDPARLTRIIGLGSTLQAERTVSGSGMPPAELQYRYTP